MGHYISKISFAYREFKNLIPVDIPKTVTGSVVTDPVTALNATGSKFCFYLTFGLEIKKFFSKKQISV